MGAVTYTSPCFMWGDAGKIVHGLLQVDKAVAFAG